MYERIAGVAKDIFDMLKLCDPLAGDENSKS